MSDKEDTGFSDFSMLELFQMEEQQQSSLITDALLNLEQDPTSPKLLESLMRASHSLKGAARMVGIDPVVDISHIMEDCFVAAQNAKLTLASNHIDILLKSVDVISQIANSSNELSEWINNNQSLLTNVKTNLNSILEDESLASVAQDSQSSKVNISDDQEKLAEDVKIEKSDGITEIESSLEEKTNEEADFQNKCENNTHVIEQSNLRIDSDQIDRLMRLAGEAAEGSRWMHKFSESMIQLKRKQVEIVTAIDKMSEKIKEESGNIKLHEMLHDVQKKASTCRVMLGDKLISLDEYERKNISVSKRLSQAVITSRMQPFGDGVGGFPRLVRDVARKLEKNVKLEIEGKGTLVDREILAKIEAPLNHLLRNAIDHGIESEKLREALGKPKTGTIRLSAYHMSGMLFITAADDGQGVDLEKLREKVYKKGLINGDMPKMLADEELLEFLFLPSFSTRDNVTEISGRGVGLDVVHDAVNEMGGVIRTFSTFGEGTTFQLQLPLTLSVVPSLLVKIENEPYAFPLARIDSIHVVESSKINTVDGHQFIDIEGRKIGLITAAQVLGLSTLDSKSEIISVVVVHDRSSYYGIVVDECFGEQDLVVQSIPTKLGKIKDISTASILENGLPVLIIDIDDLFRSIEKLISDGTVSDVDKKHSKYSSVTKTILVVDDSITVREVERNMLEAVGYAVDVAVDGMDGWHMIHQHNYDLIITDIDMPRMNGIELIHKIKSKQRYNKIPVVVVSYKDRAEDRESVFNAGADRYLTKGSFQDNSLREAVKDLIGESAV